MQRFKRLGNFRYRQTGMLTVFTAVLVLIILTLMIFYASRVGLFEQRVSANEVRQKEAFHAAEAAIDQAAEFMLANQRLILSNEFGAFPDGVSGTRNGWRADGKWAACTATLRADQSHPCGGTPPMPEGSFFYDDDVTGYELMSVEVPGAAEGVTARVTANICKVGLDDPRDCVGLDDPTPGGTFMVVTLMGYGYSDCTDVTDVTTCQGRAAVAKPLGNFKTLAGAPTVPLVTRSVFPPNGTAIVVPNPNAGGVGVPISAWVNDNDDLTPADPVTGGTCIQEEPDAVLSSGTWNTCELQEWYGREAVPAGVACDQPPGQCSCTAEESISYKVTGQNTILGIDIVKDKAFPCDLFHTFFNVKDTQYMSVKYTMPQLDAGDCSTLDAGSSGLIWVSGDTCNLNSDNIGSYNNPVVIISAASETRISGSVSIFGVLYVFDGEDAAAEFTGSGTASIYGALIVDADMSKFTGTVNVVYSDGVLLEASDLGGFGEINGGWRDFGLPAVTW